MESPGTLACSSFYARTIFSFAIPEVLIEEDKVRDEFHQDNLLKTLLQFQPMRPQFPGFQIGRPIYNFNWPRPLIIFDHAYEEQFWGAFGPVQHAGASPLHFPYQMRYNGKVERSCDWLQSSGLGPRHYASLVKFRYFPYGAASIHLTEHFEFERNCTAKEIVKLMYGKIKVEGEPDAQAVAQFFRKAADDITTRVLKPGVSYYQPESRLRSIILHFSPGAPPDLKTAWPEVQRLLAMDPHDDPYLAAKYTPENTVNQGEEGRGQFMAFSPYASLLIVPGVDKKWRRRRLRNHIGGIAELAAIQGSFLRQLRLAFELRYRELSHKPGYPRKEIIAFIRGFRDKLGDKVASVEDVLGLQSGLELEEKREWFRWYVSMANASGLGDELRQFKESLENLDKLNKEVGGAARKDLSSLYDKVTSLVSLLSSHG